MMQHNMVLGANSDLVRPLLEQWAGAGDSFALYSRSADSLEDLAHALKAAGASSVSCEALDLAQSLPIVPENERSCRLVLAQATMDESNPDHLMQLNFHQQMLMLEQCAQDDRVEQIVVFGSVAGDRPREFNYLYGSSKAALAAYCEGWQRKYPDRHLLLVKPGPIATKMTSDRDQGALWSTPDVVARDVRSALAASKRVVYSPGYWRLIMWILRAIPEYLFRKINV